MELSKYQEIRIKDICRFERAKKGKMYQCGCWGVQVSATKGQTIYVRDSQELDSKYCIFELLTNKYDSEYVYLVFRENLPRFLHRVQTGLNIVPEVFNDYVISLHDDRNTQVAIRETVKQMQKRIDEEERTIKRLQELKKYHLKGMFANE